MRAADEKAEAHAQHFLGPKLVARDPAETVRAQKSTPQRQIVSVRNPRRRRDEGPVERAVVYRDEERPPTQGHVRALSNQGRLSSGPKSGGGGPVVLHTPESTDAGQADEAGFVPGVVVTGKVVQPVDMVPGSPGRLVDQQAYYDTGEPAETMTPDRMTEPVDLVYPSDFSSAPGSPVATYVDAQNAAYPDDGAYLPGYPGKPSWQSDGAQVYPVPSKHVPGAAAAWIVPGLVLPQPVPIGVATGPVPGPVNGFYPQSASLAPVVLQHPPLPDKGVPVVAAANNRWWAWALLAGAGGFYLWRRGR